MAITNGVLKSLKAGERREIWDTTLAGFGVRVGSTGRPQFVFRYRLKTGKRRRIAIGAYPAVSLKVARAKVLDGLTGVAHGGMLSRKPTALADAVLGAVDFWEISNGFNYSTEGWYRLMNCGIFLAPGAGTDLPNQPFRDPWLGRGALQHAPRGVWLRRQILPGSARRLGLLRPRARGEARRARSELTCDG